MGLHLRLIGLIGVIVPKRLRLDWQQEWEAELHYREALLADWKRLTLRTKFDLLWRSLGAFQDALWLQQLRWEDDMFRDLRYGIRMLVKAKGFTAVAVLSLALGIGANTAIFSLLDAVLLKPLPIEHPDSLVVVATSASGTSGTVFSGAGGSSVISSFSYPIFRELRDKSPVFSGVFGHDVLPMSMSGGGQTERVLGELVSGNFFSVLGVRPYLGRVFTDSDDETPGAHAVAVVSYNFWQRRFSANPQIVGQTINLNGYPFEVIGVAAPGFQGIEVGIVPDVRIPIMMNGAVRSGPPVFENRGNSWLAAMARLRPGVSVEEAQAATDTVFQNAREPDVRGIKGDAQDARIFKSLRIQLPSARTGISSLSRQFSQPLIILMCLVGVVLLIACLNVANLLLARSATRQKEIAVRLALGAGRWRLVRQLLTEGVLLSILGGAMGLVFARWGVELLLGFLPQGRIPTVLEITPDLRILGFTLGVTVFTALLFGLAPALQATRPDLIPALKNEIVVTGGRRKWELRRLLVIMQVALSLFLLIGAGLFVRSLQNLRSVDDGYHTDQVVTLAIDPAQSGYKLDQLRDFCTRLSERAAALPGVKSVSFVRNTPLSGRFARIGVEVPGYQSRPDEEMAVLLNQVTPQFFATFGMPLLMGRDFSDEDTPDSPKVLIINESLTRYFFGAENPLGKRISLESYKDLEIVGVVADARYRNLKDPAPQTAYIPYSQYGTTNQRTLCIRGAGDPNALIAAVRKEVNSLDANLPVFNIKTFADQIDESVSRERLVALLSSFFGLFALLLASLGLYGVMSYAVARRTREMGIRLALGASAGSVRWLVLREALLVLVAGIAIGLPASLGAARLAEGLLFGLTPTDPLTIVLATLLMTAIATLAAYLPARRASRLDPMVALRYE